jgi:tRNA(Ile)-lysidine synthase
MPQRPRLVPELAAARNALNQSLAQAGISAGDSVVIALSGGSDSLALALAASHVLPQLQIASRVVVVDHGLQSGSAAVAAEALGTAEQLGLSGEVVRVAVASTGQGLEAAARESRYEALERVRAGFKAKAILLGHTADDQAESVLLGLTRGSGLRSIAGMTVFDAERKLLRPFLSLSKQSLQVALQSYQLSWWEDPHNQDESFTRVQIRKLLAELDPQISEGLVRSAGIARTAQEYLDQQAEVLLLTARSSGTGRQVSYSCEQLAQSHDAVLNTALMLALTKAGARNLSLVQVMQVAALVRDWHGQKAPSLSGITVERVKNELVLQSKSVPKIGAC